MFGCVCYVSTPDDHGNKLEAKSVKAMFIGYSHTQKGYKFYVQESRRVLVSRDVKFVESKGYYDEKSWENLKDHSHGPSDMANNLRTILESFGISQPKDSTKTRGSSSPQGTEEIVHPGHGGGGGGKSTKF